MQITSPEFRSGTKIPPRFTCDGENISPELDVAGVPAEAKSLALTVDDPDAPMGVFTHWVVWNIPPETPRIACASLPVDCVEGKNTAGQAAYAGPCPPSGTHRYIFTLYALDAKLELEAGASKDKLLEYMTGHIIGQAELVGLYSRDEKR